MDTTNSEKFRIALISLGFIDYTINLANALSKNGSDILLILPDDEIQEHITSVSKNIDIYVYKQPRFYHPKNIFLVHSLFKKISNFRPDLIHMQGVHPWFPFIMPFFRIKRLPIIITFHDVEPHLGENYLHTRLLQWFGRIFANQIIVHGERLKQKMIEKYNIDKTKVHAIPIGEHNISPFKKYITEPVEDDGKTILFFGRIREYKGLEYLIKSEPLITKEVPDAKIIIAGHGDFTKYEALMMNKNKFIVHNHRISYKEGAELFQKCSLVVLPYIDASQSGVISTAYGFKKPVVVTDVGSIPEIVDNEVTGFIVPPRDVDLLAKSIITLLKNKNLRLQMGENAYKKLKNDLAWDKIANLTMDVYCMCCTKSTQRNS